VSHTILLLFGIEGRKVRGMSNKSCCKVVVLFRDILDVPRFVDFECIEGYNELQTQNQTFAKELENQTSKLYLLEEKLKQLINNK
jgi:hypothetical protein